MPSKFLITRDGFAALVRGESVELHDPAGARCEIALEKMPIGTMQQLILRAANVTQKTRPQKIGQAGGQEGDQREADSNQEAGRQEGDQEAGSVTQSLSERAEKAITRQRRQRQATKRQKRYAEEGYQEEARSQEEAGESQAAQSD